MENNKIDLSKPLPKFKPKLQPPAKEVKDSGVLIDPNCTGMTFACQITQLFDGRISLHITNLDINPPETKEFIGRMFVTLGYGLCNELD